MAAPNNLQILAEKVDPLERPVKVTFRREYIDNYMPATDPIPSGSAVDGQGSLEAGEAANRKSRWGKLRGARLFGTFSAGRSGTKSEAQTTFEDGATANMNTTTSSDGPGSSSLPPSVFKLQPAPNGPNKFRLIVTVVRTRSNMNAARDSLPC